MKRLAELLRRITDRIGPAGGSISGRMSDDSVLVQVSPGRTTRRRPGESWSEAMNRLTEGEDL